MSILLLTAQAIASNSCPLAQSKDFIPVQTKAGQVFCRGLSDSTVQYLSAGPFFSIPTAARRKGGPPQFTNEKSEL